MEVLLGITGKDYVLIASSKAAVRGVTILKAEDDKTRTLNDHTLMAYSGEAGDTVQFAEYIQANVQLYGMRTNLTQQLGPEAVSNFVRNNLARSLRSRNHKYVNLLIGGYDTVTGKPHLYWLDYLAAKAEVPYAAHGYAAYYCLSLLDKHHNPNIDLETGKKLLKLCSAELVKRLPIDFKGLNVKLVSANGIEELGDF